MKFSAVLLALMAASTALAAPLHGNKGLLSNRQDDSIASGADASTDDSGLDTSDAGLNSTSTADSGLDASDSGLNSTSTIDSGLNATSTSTASSSTKTRECDQGDQSLAAGLNAAVTVGLGLQASVVTLQNASAAADFTDGVTRLQQFVDTMGLQIQMAQGIADDDSFAQTQLGLLASDQSSSAELVSGLSNVTSAADAADTLSTLASTFLDMTNNAQDGAGQALIDCSLPLTTISG